MASEGLLRALRLIRDAGADRPGLRLLDVAYGPQAAELRAKCYTAVTGLPCAKSAKPAQWGRWRLFMEAQVGAVGWCTAERDKDFQIKAMGLINKGLETPWGVADHVEDIGQGILHVMTLGHGGYYVPPHLLGRLSPQWRAFGAKWSQGWGECWYEEDCAWAGVCLAFPELFPADALPHAQALAKQYAASAFATRGWNLDPDANLREQLELAAFFVDEERLLLAEDATDKAIRLAELVLSLDGWLAHCGFMPERWAAGRKG